MYQLTQSDIKQITLQAKRLCIEFEVDNPSDSEEVVSEAYVKAMQIINAGKYQSHRTPFYVFARTPIRNHLQNYLAYKQRRIDTEQIYTDLEIDDGRIEDTRRPQRLDMLKGSEEDDDYQAPCSWLTGGRMTDADTQGACAYAYETQNVNTAST